MNYANWLKDHVGKIIFIVLIVSSISAWIGYGIYDHYHQSPNVTSTNNSLPSTSGTSYAFNPTSPPNNGLDANGCYTPDTVRNYENTNGCVDFNVGYTYTDSAGTVFIDQLTDYTVGVEVYIPYNSAAASIDLSQVQGKNIKATGYIQDYNGAPQVTVTELSQIGIY